MRKKEEKKNYCVRAFTCALDVHKFLSSLMVVNFFLFFFFFIPDALTTVSLQEASLREEETRLEVERLTAEIRNLKLQILQLTGTFKKTLFNNFKKIYQERKKSLIYIF